MSRATRTIRVPLNVDAQFRLPLGPAVLPVRSLVLAGCVSPLAYLLLALRLPGLWGAAGAGFTLAVAASFGLPERQGVWIGTHLVYRHAWRLLPSMVSRGDVSHALVRRVGGSIHVSRRRPAPRRRFTPQRLRALTAIPAAASVGAGILKLTPGGHHGILVLDGPAVSLSSDSYLDWCRAVTSWAGSVDCPVQFLTLMTHHDAERVGEAFDHRVTGWPRTPLLELERSLAVTLADNTLGLRHYVVLSPGTAGDDGIPYCATPWHSSRAPAAGAEEADRVLQCALRMAPGLAISVRAADRDDVAALLSHTPLGVAQAMVGADVLHIGERHHITLTTTRLPAVIDVGSVVDAMTRAHAVGVASLHLLPVTSAVAQKYLHRRSSMLRYALRQGADAVEAEVALQDTTSVVAALAQRDIVPCRVALTLSVAHSVRDGAMEAAERLGAVLAAQGFHTTEVGGPGFLPALALAPGGAPLARSLVLTSDSVAARMLPCLGTPFGDVSAPLLGVNVLNGAPAHFSVWSQPNHNLGQRYT